MAAKKKTETPKKDKVVLAYSGGLDTSVAVKWLQVEYGLDVVACCVDVGQGEDLEAARRKAEKIGAVKAVVVDARERFCRDYITPAIRANAVYEGRYVQSTSLNRPMIAEALVETAQREGAKFVAHGATAKGNDQVRFEVSVRALDPKLQIIAVTRNWGIDGITRDMEIDYAKKHGIPVAATKKSPYSVDLSIWGKSTECGILEAPWAEPPDDAYNWVKRIEKAPSKPAYVELGFKNGVPVSLDGKRMKLFDLISDLNTIGAAHGVGYTDMVENRLVGIKSRETYEAPAAAIILTAHRDLETLVLTRDAQHFKTIVEQRYSQLIYDGLWFSELRRYLQAFIEASQDKVTGTVRVKLYKGNCVVVGRKSPHSLYMQKMATYDQGDIFDHTCAEGFIKLWGLPHQVDAAVNAKKK